MKPRGQEIVQWGEAALEQLCGPVFEQVRNKFAQWRDPRARLLRQRRRAKRATEIARNIHDHFRTRRYAIGSSPTTKSKSIGRANSK